MAEEQHTYKDRITINPQVMVGKPVVKGTRIPVERVVAHLANNPDLTDLFAAYPELTGEQVDSLFPSLFQHLRSLQRTSASNGEFSETDT